MKKFLVFIFLIAGIIAKAQNLPYIIHTPTQYDVIVGTRIGLGLDTLRPPTTYGQNLRPWLETKGDNLFMWSVDEQRYVLIGGADSVVYTPWGSIPGDITNQTDLMALLNAKVPGARTLTINGTAYDLSANRSWGPFLTPADTVWLHNQIVNNGTDNLTFAQGLLRAGNTVVALNENAFWNADKLQGRSVTTISPTNGQVLKWDSDSNKIVWTTSASGYTDEQAQDAIGAMVSSEFTYTDATPVLSINAIASTKITGTKTSTFISDFSTAAQNAITLTTTGSSGVATYSGGTLNIPNYTYTLPTASTSVLGGVKVDGTTITIASGVISAVGGGGTTPDFNAVLSQGGSFSVGHTVDQNSNSFVLDNFGDGTSYNGFYATQTTLHMQTSGKYGEVDVTSSSSSAGNQVNLTAYDGTNTTNFRVSPTGIRMQDGTEGASKVLTSDAFGNATWQTPSGGGGSPAYTEYVAYVYQSGTSAPTATVFYNNTGATVTYTRLVNGIGKPYYRLTFSSAVLGSHTLIEGFGQGWTGDAVPHMPLSDGASLVGYYNIYQSGGLTIDFDFVDPSFTGVEASSILGAQPIPIHIIIYP